MQSDYANQAENFVWITRVILFIQKLLKIWLMFGK